MLGKAEELEVQGIPYSLGFSQQNISAID